MNDISSINTPVLIVGGGPAGLLASILLSQYDINHILVERRSGPQLAPAAHVINTRTMEILRAAGINTNDFYGLNNHPKANKISWVRNLGDKPIGEFILDADKIRLAHRAKISAEHTTNISQNNFEAALLKIARGYKQADIRYANKWSNFFNLKGSNISDENNNQYEITAEYLLAADGASSPVAKVLNIAKNGPSSLASYLNISCEVDITTITQAEPSLLYWCLNPRAPGVVIVHDPKKLSVYMRPLFAPYESIDDYDDKRCNEILRQLYGPELKFKITHKGVWQMSAQVADKFRQGNVFLIGDSAHRFPPTGGLGLNSGAADVHNLVWKLAAALSNELRPEVKDKLLDSYETERKPVAQANCDTSVRNHLKMDEVIRTIGLDVGQAHIPAKLRSWSIWKYLPKFLYDSANKLLNSSVDKKLNSLSPNTLEKIQISIESQAPHFDMLGAELGYIYNKTNAVSGVRDYQPSLEIGARLPHLYFKLAQGNRSSLDLVDYRSFCLFIHGPVIAEKHQLFGLGLKTIDILAAENAEEIAASYNLPPGAWMLVRPDGHIAAHS